jgi:hypothetical protein
MTANVIKSGQFITSTATEQEFICEGGPKPLFLVLVSGSVQVAVAAPNTAPVINNTYATWSTAGDKIIVEVDPGDLHLRVIGVGVLNCTY